MSYSPQQPYSPYPQPQPPQHSYQPYQAPGHPMPAGPGMAGSGPASWAKWVYLGAALLSVMSFVLGLVLMIAGADAGSSGGEALAGIGVMCFCGGFVLFLVKFVLRLVWLHGCWSWIPPEYRYTGGGRQMTPGNAVGYLFIPYFNLYWLFVTYVGLCGAMDRLAQRYRTITPAPTTLATFACIGELWPGLNIIAAPFLWFFFMKSFDHMTVEIGEAMAREGMQQPAPQPGYGPPVPAYGYGGYGV